MNIELVIHRFLSWLTVYHEQAYIFAMWLTNSVAGAIIGASFCYWAYFIRPFGKKMWVLGVVVFIASILGVLAFIIAVWGAIFTETHPYRGMSLAAYFRGGIGTFINCYLAYGIAGLARNMRLLDDQTREYILSAYRKLVRLDRAIEMHKTDA